MYRASGRSLQIHIVAAVADNGVIGRDNQLPWHLPADLARFKQLTLGGPIVMGRRTFESIGRPLPGRTSIVLSRTPGASDSAVRWVRTWEEGLEEAASLADQVAVVGGQSLFERALPIADRLHLTRVHVHVDGGITFPPVDWSRWQIVERQERAADERNPLAMTFETYQAVP